MRWLCLLVLLAGCSSEHERGKNAKDAPDRPRMTDVRKDGPDAGKDKKEAEKKEAAPPKDKG